MINSWSSRANRSNSWQKSTLRDSYCQRSPAGHSPGRKPATTVHTWPGRDALLISAESGAADLYEVKSSTRIKPEDVEDTSFQALILQKFYRIEHIYLMLVNNAYTLHGQLDLAQLLKVEDITDQVQAILPEIDVLRGEALQVAQCYDPETLEHCWKPEECICLDVCHPDLPDFSIYDIPRLGKEKKRQLEEMGIRAAREIPDSFKLSNSQREIANLARMDEPILDAPHIREELGKITYPIYFLDYESCNPVVPLYDGYKPYQQMVFQYSLHRLDGPEAEVVHFEHLSSGQGDPSLPTLASLKANLDGQGTVVVWYAPFEKARNDEMAMLHPEYAEFLQDVNLRIYDLMDMVRNGLYLHPGFKGSCSIKQVLPVMVPELSYAEMEINEGKKAAWGWWNIIFAPLEEGEKKVIADQLLAYCHLDTLAMVEIYRKLAAITN